MEPICSENLDKNSLKTLEQYGNKCSCSLKIVHIEVWALKNSWKYAY